MPDLFAAFTAEVYRTLATQIVPGLVAVSPWLVVLNERNSDFQYFIEHHSPEISLCIALASIFMGLVCEDFGSWLEIKHFGRCYKDDAERAAREQDWEEYLRTAFKTEPVGERYLRTIVLRLKFECNSAPALIIGAFGVLFMTGVAASLRFGLSGAMFAFAVYLGLLEVPKTVCLLADIRRMLMKDIRIIG